MISFPVTWKLILITLVILNVVIAHLSLVQVGKMKWRDLEHTPPVALIMHLTILAVIADLFLIGLIILM